MLKHISSIDIVCEQGYKEPDIRNHYCEDRFVALGSIYAVIDGATAIKNIDMNGLNPSAYTAQFLSRFFTANESLDISAKDLLLKANTEFRSHLQNDWPEMRDLGKLGPSAAVAVLKIHNEETASIANIGDSSGCVYNGEAWTFETSWDQKHIDTDSVLHERVAKELANGAKVSEFRKIPEIKRILHENRLLSNLDWGVFNGEKAAEEHIYGQELNLGNIEKVALLTDGMINPNLEPSKAAVIQSAKRMADAGCKAFYDEIKVLLDTDPLFQKYHRLKHMDDATGIVITFRTK